MKFVREFLQNTLVGGVLVVLPIYLALVVLLSYGLGRGVLRSIRELNSGLHRFGRGEFGTAIPIVADDELGDVAASSKAS